MQHSMSRSYRLALIFIAILLSLPLIFGGLLAEGQKRSSLENRTLHVWPDAGELLARPQSYLSGFQEYLKDRMALIVPATRIYNHFLYAVLGVSPSKKLSINLPYVFLTRHGEAQPPYYNFRNVARLADPDSVDNLEKQLGLIYRKTACPGRQIAFLVVPSKPAVYPDRLPGDTPREIVTVCKRINSGDHYLKKDHAGHWAVNLIFPLAEMIEKRDLPHFFPPEQFHVAGKSAHLVALKTLQALNIKIPDAYRAEPELDTKINDLKRALGFETRIKFWRYDYESAFGMVCEHQKPDRVKKFHKRAEEFKRFQCLHPMTEKKALVLGNSFGGPVSRHLAPGYKELVFVSFNGITHDDMARFPEFINQYAPDDLIFVFHDGGLFEWIIDRMVNAWCSD
ncbi:hypothetical protein [uncultured Desulfobacter sp.]|uniref:hypothetical protein n=1 Tax=uncultured Desulfobacter sp. TaxID=240139 RepID=UPI002AAACFBE|nr:hypothetical protein [uncultured Desulfobacter sp.]